MISVVIPLYNKADTIARTLESVFAQTYKDYEIVIVDDGSTDGSTAIVESINDSRIRLIHQKNAGVSAARNKGIDEARGEYIALLDGDDEWKPQYLQTQAKLIKSFPQCDVFVTGYEFKDQNGNVTYPKFNKLNLSEPGELRNYFEIASCSTPIICSINIVTRKNTFQTIGYFPVGVRLGEDLITWAKLACLYRIAYNPEPLAIYNFSSQSERIVPKKQPNKDDYVGQEYERLWTEFKHPYLNNLAALWHKMRMVTFVQLRRTDEARKEYAKIKSYIAPTKKDRFWYYLSFAPYSVVKFILKHKERLK